MIQSKTIKTPLTKRSLRLNCRFISKPELHLPVEGQHEDSENGSAGGDKPERMDEGQGLHRVVDVEQRHQAVIPQHHQSCLTLNSSN